MAAALPFTGARAFAAALRAALFIAGSAKIDRPPTNVPPNPEARRRARRAARKAFRAGGKARLGRWAKRLRPPTERRPICLARKGPRDDLGGFTALGLEDMVLE